MTQSIQWWMKETEDRINRLEDAIDKLINQMEHEIEQRIKLQREHYEHIGQDEDTAHKF